MKYIKTFESFSINEDTVFDTGLGGNLQYATSGDPAVKKKTLSILSSGKWMKTPSGKYAIAEAKRLTDMWNAKDPSTHPRWFSEYSKDSEGKLKESNFLSVTALIVSVLDELTKRQSATWANYQGTRSQCFRNSAEWANETGGTPIGGIVAKSEILKRYSVGELVVHAFGEKDNKYYELTFPTAGLTADIIYWPLISFKNDNELKISKDIWSYALGIEEGVGEYIKDYYLN